MKTEDALSLADTNQLDLVKIVPNAKPPVCKIMDYGKYFFEQSKKEKMAKKNQHVTNVKEVKLSASIEKHDMQVKAKQTDKFIHRKDKVKVSIRLRGRERAHPDIAFTIMETFAEYVTENFIYERKPKQEGSNIIMILAPKE